MTDTTPKEALIENFRSRVNDTPTAAGCLEWIGSVTDKGYGLFSCLGKPVRAHRMAYGLYIGAIPKGVSVLHKCNNRLCVNTQHLYLGDHEDNMRDRSVSDRHPNALWSSEEVSALRAHGVTPKELSTISGYPYLTCYNMLTGRTYKHVPMQS